MLLPIHVAAGGIAIVLGAIALLVEYCPPFRVPKRIRDPLIAGDIDVSRLAGSALDALKFKSRKNLYLSRVQNLNRAVVVSPTFAVEPIRVS